MKLIEIKKGSKTIYKFVDDNWVAPKVEDKEYGDLTTGGRKSISFGLNEEQYEQIFGGKKHGN